MDQQIPVSILMVDDEPRNLMALEAILWSVECNLVSASSGVEALKCLLKDTFAVILLDIRMPGMDGLELASLIRERDSSRDTPIIFLTADGSDKDRLLDGYRVGAVDYLVKPFDPHILRAKVAVFVELFRKTAALEQRTAELTAVTTELLRREQEVGALNAALEDRVARRTAALTAAVSKLEAEVLERRRVEETLRSSEERLRAIWESAADGMVLSDPDGIVLAVNPAYCRLYGLPAESLVGQGIDLVLPEIHRVASRENYQAAFQAAELPSAFQSHVTAADGSSLLVEIHVAFLLQDDQRVALLSVVRDITARDAAEMALAASDVLLRDSQLATDLSEQRYRSLFEHNPDSIVVFNLDARIVAVNDAAIVLSGHPRDAMLGGQARDYLAPERGLWHQALRGFLRARRGQPSSYESVLIRGDGVQVPVAVTNMPILVDGRAAGVFAVAHDISDRVAMESQRDSAARNEKLRALGQMASGIAHDLNQSLMLVLGYSELALNALNQDPPELSEMRQLLTTTSQAALDGGQSVKRLLQFTRTAPESETSFINLPALVRDAAQLTAPIWRDAAQAAGAPISLHVEAEHYAMVMGSPAQLREAMTNLIFNAVDAMPTGGTICLAVAVVDAEAVIEVSDSGSGMTAEIQERVFEPFFTTKGEGGSGLGLAMVFKIVDQHGGRITIVSAPGEGTTFCIHLPLALAEGETPPPEAPAEVPAVPHQLRVLVVDDEPMLARAVKRMLEAAGHMVSTAQSGEDALRDLNQQPVDLVISDLGMGAGMNGWELAEAVRESWPEVRFILSTGWGASIDPVEARVRGVEAVLAKPYRVEELYRVVGASEKVEPTL